MTHARKQISGRYPDERNEEITARIRWLDSEAPDREPVAVYDDETEADLRALASEVRDALYDGAEGVLIREGEVVFAWDWGVVEILRDEAEDDGREDLARICTEILAAEEEVSDGHRRAIWDALVESDGEVRRPTILRSVSDVYGAGEFEGFEEFRLMVWESFREDAPMLFRRPSSDPRLVANWEDSTGRVVLEEVRS